MSRATRRLSALMAGVLVIGTWISTAQSQTVSVDAATLEQLQQIIQQQQKQLEQQFEQLKSQAGTINALEQRLNQLEEDSRETKAAAKEAKETAEEAVVTMQSPAPGRESSRVVSADNPDKIKLAISGQINRAINVVGDGRDTDAYFVDNDVSNSRVRFVGTGNITPETLLGTRMEIAFSPNNSSDVSQSEESPDDFIDVRKVEAFARNDSYGQIQFGKGQAAADDTAEFDLSLVAGPIMYSGVADIVGGLFFTENDELTGIRVDDAFFNFDGKRQDRVRYDSPVIGPGLQLSGSAGDSQQYDVALTWGGDYGDWSGVEVGPFTTLGAVSFQDPDADDVDWRVAGSFSGLHNPTGLSLTVSGGMDSFDEGDDPYNLYGKIGWDQSFFSIGDTGFGVDFTYSENVSAENDEGTSFGFAAIQLLEDYGTEIYAQFRVFDLDRDESPAVNEIYVGTVGTRVKF
ncbi:MAG: hypothetical protein QNJ67_18450 [Kiloniellales bacterium]|nr:hypothetical protein [Kiloniellales bacterium]